ncbi:unnamed protein product [Anisakis simplex]|uniref:Serine/threonine-protein phosphatase 2A activator n=1 Tax=Anisakis simplex TaxID=6269 RepID=A0A0M3JX78_ANISI|nr:unnamed protein product [Anisakis simplex]
MVQYSVTLVELFLESGSERFVQLIRMTSNGTYVVPQKEIKSIFDITKWCQSKAYAGYMEMIHELNDSVKGILTTEDIPISPNVMEAIDILDVVQLKYECGLYKVIKLPRNSGDIFKKWTLEYPPEDMGEQRFGNKSYRKWYERLTQEADDLIYSLLPANAKGAVQELVPYLLDSFGNATRIDYGSGHEASYLVLMYCLRKLGVFSKDDNRALVLRVFLKYLRVVRCLQITYRMEPAGSRGVHALDDFQFIPFLWGSSQLIGNKKRLIPDSYLNPQTVELNAPKNLFFDAVQYINETKTGPFHEHSNQLWNISAVQTWEKVNSGMFKMYEAEVLKKFPVVQHFLFGTIFSFEPANEISDPNLLPSPPKTSSQNDATTESAVTAAESGDKPLEANNS